MNYLPLEGKNSLVLRYFVFALIAVWVLSTLTLSAQETELHKKHYVIGVALGLPPYSFLDENGRVAGYSVDLTRAIAQVMQVDIEIIIGPWGEIRQALETGEIDAAPMYYSVERDKLVDFSSPFSIVHNAIFMRRDTTAIKVEEDLRDKDIIVIRGDIMHNYMNSISDNLVLVSTESDALRLLASGEHDYALMARIPGLYWVKELKLSNIVTLGPLILPSQICYAVAEGNTELKNLLTESLVTLGMTGESKLISDKWLESLVPGVVSPVTALKYIIYAIVPLLILLALAMVWSRSLKRQVTERTHELSESEERFRTIFQNSPVLINSFDGNGRCILWNKECRKTFGWTMDEINTHDFPMTLFYPDPAVYEEVMRTVTSDPNGRFREWHPVTKEGKTLITMWANFHLPSGQVFSQGHDITKLRETEDELTDHRNHLEELVKKRTAELEVKNTKLEKYNRLFVDREFRIKELRNRVKKLEGGNS